MAPTVPSAPALPVRAPALPARDVHKRGFELGEEDEVFGPEFDARVSVEGGECRVCVELCLDVRDGVTAAATAAAEPFVCVGGTRGGDAGGPVVEPAVAEEAGQGEEGWGACAFAWGGA